MRVFILLMLLAVSCSLVAQTDERAESAAAHARWKTGLIQALRNAGDADSLLAALLIAEDSGEQGAAAFDRVYAVGKSNPKVLWLAALYAVCPLPYSGVVSKCDRKLTAARALIRVDPGNAMAWLTFAFVANRAQLGSEQIYMALARAAKAPRFHDYAFDVIKLVVIASGRLVIPEKSLPQVSGRRKSPAEVRLELLGMGMMGLPTGAYDIGLWVKNGCRAYREPLPDTAQTCAAAWGLFKRGDSQITLIDNPDASKVMKGDLDFMYQKKDESERLRDGKQPGIDGFVKARLESYTLATSERDYYWRLAARLAAKPGPSQ